MNRDLLEAPFPPEAIRQREGNFGHLIDYIEGHSVIQRLNDDFSSLMELGLYWNSSRSPVSASTRYPLMGC